MTKANVTLEESLADFSHAETQVKLQAMLQTQKVNLLTNTLTE